MGAGQFRSPTKRCQAAVRRVRTTFLATSRNKPRARSLIHLLRLAVRPNHAEILYKCGAVEICIDVLIQEQKGSPIRELALVALLCLTLDNFVKRDFVESDKKKFLDVLIKVVGQERPGTSVKYAAIAVLHSLSRDSRNLKTLYEQDNFSICIMEAISFENEGSPLRKLACDIVCSLSEVKEFHVPLYRSFNDLASRVLIGEIGNHDPQVMETALQIIANLAENTINKELIVKERIVMNCGLKVVEVSNSAPKLRLAGLKIFYQLSLGTEQICLKLAQLTRLIQSAMTLIEPTTPLKDDCGLLAIQLFHRFSIFKSSRAAMLIGGNVGDVLIVHSRTNVFARMGYINCIGAFEEEELDDLQAEALRGCEEMDDKIVELLREWCEKDLDSEYEQEQEKILDIDDENEETGEVNESTLSDATLLTLSVLLRRDNHLERLRIVVSPLILLALDKAIRQNNVRCVSFALSCLRSLMRGNDNKETFELETLLDLLGRIQQKVHPSWVPVRVDAERLISRMSASSKKSNANPGLDMLERVLDDNRRGYTYSLDVPLSSLTYSLAKSSKEEKVETSKQLVKLLPRALTQAVKDDDLLSAKYAIGLFQNVTNEQSDDKQLEDEKVMLAAEVRAVLSGTKWSFIL